MELMFQHLMMAVCGVLEQVLMIARELELVNSTG